MRLGGVLEDPQAVLVRDGLDGVHVGRVAVEVHRHDRRVRSVTAARTLSAARQNWSGSMSAKTGVAPVSATELAVAANVNDGTMTSSPGPMPAASRPRWRPEVPELTATHVRPEVSTSANSVSKAATSGPWAIMPDLRTRSTASRSRSPTIGLAAGMKVSDMGASRGSGRVGSGRSGVGLA